MTPAARLAIFGGEPHGAKLARYSADDVKLRWFGADEAGRLESSLRSGRTDAVLVLAHLIGHGDFWRLVRTLRALGKPLRIGRSGSHREIDAFIEDARSRWRGPARHYRAS
jgi:hypothetical protein